MEYAFKRIDIGLWRGHHFKVKSRQYEGSMQRVRQPLRLLQGCACGWHERQGVRVPQDSRRPLGGRLPYRSFHFSPHQLLQREN